LEAGNHYQVCQWRDPEAKTAKLIQSMLAELLKIPAGDISLGSSIFDLGANSLNLMFLKAKVQDALGTNIDIPMPVLLKE
jgi:acyl carrier protein